jgi:hypothetical protein
VILENAILRLAHKKTLLMRLFWKTHPSGEVLEKSCFRNVCVPFAGLPAIVSVYKITQGSVKGSRLVFFTERQGRKSAPGDASPELPFRLGLFIQYLKV